MSITFNPIGSSSNKPSSRDILAIHRSPCRGWYSYITCADSRELFDDIDPCSLIPTPAAASPTMAVRANACTDEHTSPPKLLSALPGRPSNAPEPLNRGRIRVTKGGDATKYYVYRFPAMGAHIGLTKGGEHAMTVGWDWPCSDSQSLTILGGARLNRFSSLYTTDITSTACKGGFSGYDTIGVRWTGTSGFVSYYIASR